MKQIPAPFKLNEPARKVSAEPDRLSLEVSERLADYLETAEDLVLAPGTRQSPLSGNPDHRVRVGVMTDGEWVWDLAWADLVRESRISPGDDFMQHVERLEFVPPEVSEERITELCEALDIPY
ncbi:hypothetical protein [Streptomyces sp. Tue6028]|uniref:hypothetical protein n=1 Tax=Streptomyces sp. Tue6028 TaxID=2036037 RepID=UPI003EB69934